MSAQPPCDHWIPVADQLTPEDLAAFEATVHLAITRFVLPLLPSARESIAQRPAGTLAVFSLHLNFPDDLQELGLRLGLLDTKFLSRAELPLWQEKERAGILADVDQLTAAGHCPLIVEVFIERLRTVTVITGDNPPAAAA